MGWSQEKEHRAALKPPDAPEVVVVLVGELWPYYDRRVVYIQPIFLSSVTSPPLRHQLGFVSTQRQLEDDAGGVCALVAEQIPMEVRQVVVVVLVKLDKLAGGELAATAGAGVQLWRAGFLGDGARGVR